MAILRPLQEAAVASLRAAVEQGARRVLFVAPTGFGKTVVLAAIVRGHLESDSSHSVLIVVHRRELVRQTVDKLTAAGVESVGVLQADLDTTCCARVVVASLQTLASRGTRPPATMVIWDEAHHCPASSFFEVYQCYPGALHIGATATPQRADGKPLGDIFEQMVVGATARELTSIGQLVPSEVFLFGDVTRELSCHPIEAYWRCARGRPTVVFASSVAHARQLSDEFAAIGVSAACIDGEISSDTRDAHLAAFERGALDVLTNVFCLTEGWDAPRAEVCILARAPDHVGTYLQMIGRVLRPHEGKRIATVVDLRGSAIVHGLPDEDRQWSLTGKACVRVEKMTALRRCTECLAVFRPTRACPRCGATHEVFEKLPRTLTRAEKAVRWSDVDEATRDRLYLAKLVSIAQSRMRMTYERATWWARARFVKSRGREPEMTGKGGGSDGR